ncbi:MAG: hypothetical protein Q7S76_01855 [bacterium]|nr:hypothetical protein [bacterium]
MKLRASHVAAICYSDIFEYPLTNEEITRWAVGRSFLNPDPSISADVSTVSALGRTFLVLSGREDIVGIRLSKEKLAQKKWTIARRVAVYLSYIPTVTLIGVTGGLSMDNVRNEDDIDMFFVVAPHTIWVSRFLITVVVECLGLRRRPHQSRVKNKICLNMLVTEDGLEVPPHERDVFSAHEVLQLIPLWSSGRAYVRFLTANQWVSRLFPNAWAEAEKKIIFEEKRTRDVFSSFFSRLVGLFEVPCRFIQTRYMRKRRTVEIISDTVLRFHPKDARDWIKKSYGSRLRKFDMPLDKYFYAR